MKSFLFAVSAILVATPAIAHPRFLKGNNRYYYPEPNVMVRNDRKRCKKIVYTTKYDEWGWFTTRTIKPLKNCRNYKKNYNYNHHTITPQVNIIIK